TSVLRASPLNWALCVRRDMSPKRILIGGVGLVKGRPKNLGVCIQEVCSILEPMLEGCGWSDNAPFHTLSLIIRYGSDDSRTVEFGCINKKYSELNVSITTSLMVLKEADKHGELQSLVMELAKKSIQKVSTKYGLAENYT
ncbi:Imm39 family immunity protein, partial [Vibrio parahaemolyticus]